MCLSWSRAKMVKNRPAMAEMIAEYSIIVTNPALTSFESRMN
jgi:hypothetical protein